MLIIYKIKVFFLRFQYSYKLINFNAKFLSTETIS